MKANISMNLDEAQAFYILLQTLNVKMPTEPEFEVKNGEIVVSDYDDRGELYLALYHLATKIFPNTEFRRYFDDPNTLMSSLYAAKEESEDEDE